MHLLLNKSEVLTRRPFSRLIATGCGNSYKHSQAGRNMSNIYLKSKGYNVFVPLFVISLHTSSRCDSLHFSSSLWSQLLTHQDAHVPPPPPPGYDFPLSILFCCHPCGFHTHICKKVSLLHHHATAPWCMPPKNTSAEMYITINSNRHVRKKTKTNKVFITFFVRTS